MEELEKNCELEAIKSLEHKLPIELSFLIRQQAYCKAELNYLQRQIREIKESANHQQQVDINRVPSTSMSNRIHSRPVDNNRVSSTSMSSRIHSRPVDSNRVPSTSMSNRIFSRPIDNIAASTMAHTKNGNFILSDDSGGDYSRATMSDDDELSSLLDQIAKTVLPDQRNRSINSHSQVQYLQQQQQPHQQPYTIINHQQAVPILVMSSPIAVAHPSSISSNTLPGVHFHFDTSISAVEQLVSRKEKRQIASQLKAADNWLNMRTFDQQEGSLKNGGNKQAN
jgi:hypothetical protein